MFRHARRHAVPTLLRFAPQLLLQLLLLPWLAHAAPAPTPSAAPSDPYEFLNAEGLPLLMPTNRSTDGRGWYFEVPRDPVGTLVMLHRCGRNAEDFWPPSEVCPQCIGMPEGVSISKQALARGYAILAINSADRQVGSGARCWSWGPDAVAVRDIVEGFREEQGLQRLPLYFTGCSSGGSLALRLPGIMRIDGIMPVAISLSLDAFPLMDPRLKHPYPSVAFVHFAKDANTVGKVAGMVREMGKRGVPAAEALVEEAPIAPDFFARRDDMISLAVSQRLHAAFKEAGALGDGDFLADEVEGVVPAWEPVLREQLGRLLEAEQQEQLALKNRTTLALAQQALDAAGKSLLSIQEVSADEAAAAVKEANSQDDNPNFSSSDGMSSSSGGMDPFLSDLLMEQRIKEEIAVSWAEHTNVGDYTTAALAWLERCGRASFYNLAQRYLPAEPATLSPIRTASAEEVAAVRRACRRPR